MVEEEEGNVIMMMMMVVVVVEAKTAVRKAEKDKNCSLRVSYYLPAKRTLKLCKKTMFGGKASELPQCWHTRSTQEKTAKKERERENNCDKQPANQVLFQLCKLYKLDYRGANVLTNDNHFSPPPALDEK